MEMPFLVVHSLKIINDQELKSITLFDFIRLYHIFQRNSAKNTKKTKFTFLRQIRYTTLFINLSLSIFDNKKEMEYAKSISLITEKVHS